MRGKEREGPKKKKRNAQLDRYIPSLTDYPAAAPFRGVERGAVESNWHARAWTLGKQELEICMYEGRGGLEDLK